MTDPGRTKGQVPLCLWRWGLSLCALPALTSCSGPETGPVPEPEEPPRAEAVEPQEAPAAGPEEELSADGLPLVIPLEAQELEPPALEAGDPAAALASEDVAFSDRLDSGVELEIRRASPVPDNGTIFYDVYALTRTLAGDWTVLGRLSEYNHYVGNFGLDAAERVPDILGQEGWQISLGIGAAAVTSWYFAAGPGGAELVLDVSSSQEAEAADLDGDGQGEAWEYCNHGGAGWSFYDRDPEGRFWRYFLPEGPEGPLGAVMDPEKGFVPADREGSALLRACAKAGAGMDKKAPADPAEAICRGFPCLSGYPSGGAKTRLPLFIRILRMRLSPCTRGRSSPWYRGSCPTACRSWCHRASGSRGRSSRR